MTEHEGVQVKSQLPGIARALKAVKDRVRKENKVSEPIVSVPVEDVREVVAVASEPIVSVPVEDASAPVAGASVSVIDTGPSKVVKKKGTRTKAVKARASKGDAAAGARASVAKKRSLDSVTSPVMDVAGARASVAKKRRARVSETPDAVIKAKVGSGNARVLSNLVLEDFNAKEVLVLRQLQTQAQPLTIQILSELCFRDLDSKRTSWARNSLRRLVRDGAVEQVGRGLYAITQGGKQLFTS